MDINLEKDNKALQKVSFKNMRNFEDIENSIASEVKRQVALLKAGKEPVAEVRKYNPLTKESVTIRTNDTSVDFRYLADPDIPAIRVHPDRIEKARAAVLKKRIPFEIKKELRDQYNLDVNQINHILTQADTIPIFHELCKDRNPKDVY